jgi:3-oxoacyl-[acyl-carrier protein] reductase
MMHKGKNIVVVGASRGIGKELVKIFASNPENTVFALARSKQAMQEFESYNNVQIFTFDLSSNDVRQHAETIFKSVNHIDILINNAGKLVNKSFLDLSFEEISESYQVNIVGVMQTVQAVVPKMTESGGHIVNISSMGGFQGSVKFAGLSAYSTSKAALVSFTELFAEEYKESKIAMNCLCLGAVQTEMLEEAFPGYLAPLSAHEMASYIVDFSLNASKYIRGKIIPVSLSTP